VVLVTEDDLAAAVIATIVANGGRAYDLDDAKALTNPPASYVEVTVERRFGGEQRACGGYALTGYRLNLRAVGTTVSNVRNARSKADLEGVRLAVDGAESTAVQFETQDSIGQDNDWWSGMTTFTTTF
jgi:hypothetical protein